MALAPAAQAAQAQPRWKPDVQRGERLGRRSRRTGVVLPAHRAPRMGPRPAARGPVGERGQGDAARGLPPARRGPRARAHGGRPRPADADGALVRQRDRHQRPQHRRATPVSSGSPAARACGASAPRRSGATRASTRPTSRATSSTSTALCRGGIAPTPCGCSARSSLAALGHRARATARLGALLQGRLGLGLGCRGPPGGTAPPRPPAVGRGDHDHGEPEPRLREGTLEGVARRLLRHLDRAAIPAGSAGH